MGISNAKWRIMFPNASDHCSIVQESNKGKEFVLKTFLGSRQLGLETLETV